MRVWQSDDGIKRTFNTCINIACLFTIADQIKNSNTTQDQNSGKPKLQLAQEMLVESFTEIQAKDTKELDFNSLMLQGKLTRGENEEVIASFIEAHKSYLSEQVSSQNSKSIKDQLLKLNSRFKFIHQITFKYQLIENHISNFLKNQNQYDRRDIVIARDSISFSIIRSLSKQTEASLLQKFNCYFKGEPGIDAGGVRREVYAKACEEIFDPALGLFKASSDGCSLEINPISHTIPFYLKYFEYAGIILAKAITD